MNTLDIEAGRDELATPAAARAWLRRWELIGPRARVDLPALAAFRERMRDALEGHDIGHGAAPGGSARTGTALDLPVVVRVDSAGAVSFGPSDATDPIARLSAIIATEALGPAWPRLKVCANDACRWVFFNSSRNGAGKWCTMKRCGTLMNVRAFRRRQRIQAATPRSTEPQTRSAHRIP